MLIRDGIKVALSRAELGNMDGYFVVIVDEEARAVNVVTDKLVPHDNAVQCRNDVESLYTSEWAAHFDRLCQDVAVDTDSPEFRGWTKYYASLKRERCRGWRERLGWDVARFCNQELNDSKDAAKGIQA